MKRAQVREALEQVPIDQILGVKGKLTHKQKTFARLVAQGETGAGAMRKAYDVKTTNAKTVGNNASALKKHKGIQREIDKLLTDGWILEEDYLGFNMPRPKVLQVKQFVIPKAEFDAMAIINVGAEILSNTSKGQEIKKEATQDKNTSEFLNQIVNYGQKVAPKEGEKVVMLVKIDPNSVDGDTDKAGFGNAVLPILIGVGVLMALNKGKKLQNG